MCGEISVRTKLMNPWQKDVKLCGKRKNLPLQFSRFVVPGDAEEGNQVRANFDVQLYVAIEIFRLSSQRCSCIA